MNYILQNKLIKALKTKLNCHMFEIRLRLFWQNTKFVYLCKKSQIINSIFSKTIVKFNFRIIQY